MRTKIVGALLLASCAVSPLYAQQQELLRFDAETRVDYQYIGRDRDGDFNTNDASTGFQGKYLMFRVDGIITEGLTYSWRQRFNKAQAFFNGTDWLYLNYSFNDWSISGGKEVVAIGGYEYDRYPVDIYGSSVFWNNAPCFKFAAAIGYNITSHDNLKFQISESPFINDDNHNIYGYNLLWSGSHGFYESIWSANMMEYAKGKFINYLALGNKFKADKMWLEFDFMNRAASHQKFFFKDCSVMAELSYKPDSRWRVFGKYTYDVNHAGNGADLIVTDGTELSMAGAGVEFFPLVNTRHRLRLHASCFYSWGKNANSGDLMQDKTLYVSTGLTWDMNLLSIKKK